MQIQEKIFTIFFDFLPTLIVFIVLSIFLLCCHWFLIKRRPELGNEQKFPLHMLMLFLITVSILAIVIALPIDKSSRNQIIGLIGILLSGIIAFSSTHMMANLMAGVLLRITKHFRTGDFIRVGEFFGRVSERGLFGTEIQSENRELITIPNDYLVKNPFTTIRSSGAIISVTLSLGYDIHHLQIEPLLIKAAEDIGLEDPFVHILELGNFSVTYRISALLTEVKGLLTARSNLSKSILKTLHNAGIEIMSPTFMNQRQLGGDTKIIPTFMQSKPTKKMAIAEEIVFDKAEMAEQIELEKQHLIEDIKILEAKLNDNKHDNTEQMKESLEKKRHDLKAVELADLPSN